MRKCYVCGRRFRLLAKNRYEVVKSPAGLNRLSQDTVYYNAFNCPHCGCQNIVGVFEKVNVKDFENESQTEKADFIDIPEGATNGDMVKLVFPDIAIEIHFRMLDDWWNSPYRKEQG